MNVTFKVIWVKEKNFLVKEIEVPQVDLTGGR